MNAAASHATSSSNVDVTAQRLYTGSIKARLPMTPTLLRCSGILRIAVIISSLCFVCLIDVADPVYSRQPGGPQGDWLSPRRTVPAGPQAFCAALRADGKTLALSNASTVRLFDAEAPDKVQEIKLPLGEGEMKMFSPDATRVAVAFEDRLEFWDVDTRQRVSTVQQKANPVEFSANGERMLAEFGTVVAVDSGQVAFKSGLQPSTIARDGSLLAGWRKIGPTAYELLVVAVDNGVPLTSLTQLPDVAEWQLGQLAFTPDQQCLVWLRPTKSRRPLDSSPGAAYVEQMQVEIMVWRLANGLVVANFDSGVRGGVVDLQFAGAGRYLLAACDGWICCWDLKKAQALPGVNTKTMHINHLLLPADGKTAITIVNWATGAERRLIDLGRGGLAIESRFGQEIEGGADVGYWSLEKLLEERPANSKVRPERRPPTVPRNLKPSTQLNDLQRAEAWLRLAKKYLKEGRKEQARKYAGNVAALVPKTALAQEADEILKELAE